MPMESQIATVELEVEYLVDEYANKIERQRSLCRKLRLMDMPATMKFPTPIQADDVTLEEEDE